MDAFAELSQGRRVWFPHHGHAIGFRNAISGMSEAVGKISVIGNEDQP